MNQTATPMTDAALEVADGHLIVNPELMALQQVTELARRLERDRAELIAALEGVCDGWDNWADKGRIERAIDEARATLARAGGAK